MDGDNMDLLKDYDANKLLYQGFLERIEHLLNELLQQHGINIHSLTFRVKERESLENKIKKHKGSYTCLDEITDIAGVRITTYFEDDVTKIAEILDNEFQIDLENSMDKKALLDPDRFGYLSNHHIVSFDDGRCMYPEYKRYKTLKAEVQTRSILQHAWAEIEHDLGYKAESGVPKNIRRRLSRLAGLLELADEEFITIRNELEEYAAQVAVQIKQSPKEVGIDLVSLRTFVETNKIVNKLDLAIADFQDTHVVEEHTYMNNKDVEALGYFGIQTIDDLENALTSKQKIIVEFSKLWIHSSDGKLLTVSQGLSVFYLYYILLVEADEKSIANIYLEKYFGAKGTSLERFYNEILETYNSISL